MKRVMRMIIVAVVALLAMSSAAARAMPQRTPPGTIVWSQFNLDFSAAHLVSAKLDGTGVSDVTVETSGIFDFDPSFSPDGQRIVYGQNHDDGSEMVAMVAVDGGPVTVVDVGCVDPCVAVDGPTWTPDGQRILFTLVVGPFENETATSAVLYSANVDGSDVRRLSEPGIDGRFEDYRARYSPDGQYLVFVRVRNRDGHIAIFRMQADGTNVRRLTPWALDADLPDLSPAADGPTRDLVVFETHGHGPTETETQKIATVPATCASTADCKSQIRYVTPNVSLPDAAFNPAWSPDGRSIVYVAFTDRGQDLPPLGIIWTVRFNGHDPQQVSDGERFAFRPDWSAG